MQGSKCRTADAISVQTEHLLRSPSSSVPGGHRFTENAKFLDRILWWVGTVGFPETSSVSFAVHLDLAYGVIFHARFSFPCEFRVWTSTLGTRLFSCQKSI